MNIYEKIFTRLEELHMSQIELSRRTGIATSTISDWRKKKINQQADKLVAICKALDMSNLGAQGIFKQINGIIVGKPQNEKYYEEYKEVYRTILKEFNCESLPVLYNVNIGHATPIGLLPLGIKYEIDLDIKIIRLLESAT